MRIIEAITLTVLSISLSVAVFAQATWKSDPNHSKLTFTTTHLGISDIAGLFKTFEATVSASQANFSDAVFKLFVEVKSIDTEVDMRDDHRRSEDFFHAEAFPVITYRSTAIERVGQDKYRLVGQLTLHGITKGLPMDLWYRGTIENPQSKAVTSGFQLTDTLKRSDFNIGPRFPAPMISDEVQIKADGEFLKQEG